MWNSIKKFFGPSKRDKERIERWRELTNSDDKLTIEHFDKAVNPEEEDEMEEVQVTKHMSIKEKKSKLEEVTGSIAKIRRKHGKLKNKHGE